MAKLRYPLSVRALVHRAMQTGDIHFRFSSKSSGIEGVRGHQKLQKARGSGYIAEQTVKDEIETDQFVIELKGRADGYWPDPNDFIVEEIKTTKVSPGEVPEQVAKITLGPIETLWLSLSQGA